MIGYAAGNEATAGDQCFVGESAGRYNTTGVANTFVGRQAGKGGSTNKLTGSYNVYLGAYAGYESESGSQNVAVGYFAGRNITSGAGNVLVGPEAGNDITSGGTNCCFGNDAGRAITTGSNNICLGQDSGRATEPGGELTTGSNQFILGDSEITHIYAAVTTITSSDKRDKTDITPLNGGLSWINKLDPVTYRWDKRSNYLKDKHDPTENLDDVVTDGTHKKPQLCIGLLAQDNLEIEKEHGYGINPDTGEEDKEFMIVTDLTDDKKQYGLQYERLVPVLINAVKELSAKNEALEARLAALESK